MEEISIQLTTCKKDKIKNILIIGIWYIIQVLHAKSLGGIGLDCTAHCNMPHVYSAIALPFLHILGPVGAI